MKEYDLIIIGAGPAGLTSAIYATRYKLNVLVIGKLLGGLAGEAHQICNFPSYAKISGIELMNKIINQVKELNVEITAEEVYEIKKRKNFEIITNKSKYFSRAIILAMGSERKKLQLPREKEFTGKGISYCATCDGRFYKDKTVGVVGGGNAALTTALFLAEYAKKVYIIYKQSGFFRADPIWISKVKKNKKISCIFDSVVTSLNGKEKLEEIQINRAKKLKIGGLFVEVGNVPNIELAEKLHIKLEGAYIQADKFQRTNIRGVFAAGDITNNSLKQIVTACSEGAIAAFSAYEELIKK